MGFTLDFQVIGAPVDGVCRGTSRRCVYVGFDLIRFLRFGKIGLCFICFG